MLCMYELNRAIYKNITEVLFYSSSWFFDYCYNQNIFINILATLGSQ